MPRTLPTDFATQCDAASAAPYFVLGINWGTAASPIWRYYLDRPSASFSAAGQRVPASGVVASAVVMDWGQNPMEIREQAVNSVASRTIALEDTEGHLRALLNAGVKQQKGVLIYRMFDHADVTWPGDAVTVFAGTLLPFQWSESDCIVRLQLEDAARRFFPDVGFPATYGVFGDTLPAASRDQHIPLCWGRCTRVPARLVSAPWETKTRESFVETSLPATVPLDDHPSDLGITTLGSAISPIFAWLGPDLVTGYFTESGSPDDTPSTFTIVSGTGVTVAAAAVEMVIASGTRDAYVRDSLVRSGGQQVLLSELVSPGDSCRVFCYGTTNDWVDATVASVTANDPWPGWHRVELDAGQAQDEMTPGSAIHFLSGTVMRRGWPSGTTLRAYDQTHVYLANALPSKSVLSVEGFGDVLDAQGSGRKDFVRLGKSHNEILVGTTPSEDADYECFSVDLADDTWEVDFGQKVTSLTFRLPPRSMNPSLDSDQIWVTLMGVPEDEDPLDPSLVIENPALVLLEYLQNAHLMGLDAAYIDSASFAAAAVSHDGLQVGWAQLRPMRGVEVLQEIARQCHTLVILDGDKVLLKVLENSSTSYARTFDTGSNQSPVGSYDNILAESLSLGETPVTEIVTHLEGRWRRAWDENADRDRGRVVTVSAGALAQFARRVQEFPIDLYWKRAHVELELEFWHLRWSAIWGEVRFTGYLDALRLLPGDWIEVSYWAGLGSALGTGADLKTHAANVVSSEFGAYTFSSADVGRKLIVTAGTGWTVGDYTIESVSGVQATLDRDCVAAHPKTGGSFQVRATTDVVLHKKACEVRSVSDAGPAGTVEIVARYPKFQF